MERFYGKNTNKNKEKPNQLVLLAILTLAKQVFYVFFQTFKLVLAYHLGIGRARATTVRMHNRPHQLTTWE